MNLEPPTPIVIAEVGNNHEGDAALAERLVHLAADAGADAVKFQTFRTRSFTGPADPARIARLESFELAADVFRHLAGVARSRGLLFISTPLDLDSAELVIEIADAVKIASGDITFTPLLDRLATCARPLLLSTGMAELETIGSAVERLGRSRLDLALLHCVSGYPVPPEQANLQAIPALAEAFDHPVGYSDHTLGNDAAIAAVALGAVIVEKHFTIAHDHSDFRDHRLAATPDELSRLVRSINGVGAMLGTGAKIVQPCEEDNLTAARRSLAAATDLPAGTIIEPKHLICLRPAVGVAPGEAHRLLGRRLVSDVTAGEPVLPALLSLEVEDGVG